MKGGISWSNALVPSNVWQSVASSSSGEVLVAIAFNGGIYTYTEYNPTPTLQGYAVVNTYANLGCRSVPTNSFDVGITNQDGYLTNTCIAEYDESGKAISSIYVMCNETSFSYQTYNNSINCESGTESYSISGSTADCTSNSSASTSYLVNCYTNITSYADVDSLISINSVLTQRYNYSDNGGCTGDIVSFTAESTNLCFSETNQTSYKYSCVSSYYDGNELPYYLEYTNNTCSSNSSTSVAIPTGCLNITSLNLTSTDVAQGYYSQTSCVALTLSQPTSQPSSQPSLQPSSQPSSQPTFQPTDEPTSQPSLQPTGQPTDEPTSQPTSQPSSHLQNVTYTCLPYNASTTNNDQQNYTTCYYTHSGLTSVTVTASVCSNYDGDTFLRAYINGTQVAFNDDSCGIGSSMNFQINPGETVFINEGCFASGSCSGTVVLTFSNILTLWKQTSAPIRNWTDVTSDSSGRNFAAVEAYGGIYTSTSG